MFITIFKRNMDEEMKVCEICGQTECECEKEGEEEMA